MSAEAGRNQPIEPSKAISRVVNNVISQLLFGSNSSDEPEFERAIDTVARILNSGMKSERRLPFIINAYASSVRKLWVAWF